MRLGIDFGTCYSSAALLIDGIPRPIKEPLKQSYSFPSTIYLTEREEILVGQAAENKRLKNVQRYRREFKRDLGSPDPYPLGNSMMLPEELVTEVLKKLKQEAEKVAIERGKTSLTEVVITVPATYQSHKRNLMQEACIKAGFKQIQLLEEPVAAAIYYSSHATVNSGDIILIYDLGGGTFDATLIQKQHSDYQLLGIPRGLSNCGGIEFDRKIYQELESNCSQELQQLLNTKDAWLARATVSDLCRDLKHQLSEEQEATIYITVGLGQVEAFSLSRQAFNQKIASLVEETIDCCDQLVRNTGIDWSQINQVLLVGGSCRIPYVKEAVVRKWGGSPLLVDEPELAVCLGAAVYEIQPWEDDIKIREEQEAELQRKRQEEVRRKREEELWHERNKEAKHQQQLENLFNHKTEAETLIDEGKYEEAVAKCQKIILLAPNDAEAHCYLGMALSSSEKLEEAKAEFQEAIRLDSNLAVAHAWLGTVLFQENKLKKAKSEFQQAIHLNPNDPRNVRAHALLGLILHKQGKLEEAIAEYKKAICLNPNYALAHNNLGNILHEQEKLEEAITEYKKAIRLNPNDADAQNNLRNILYEQEKLEESKSKCQKVESIDNIVRTTFDNVWYRSGENRWRDMNVFAMQDKGTLVVKEDSLEFQGKKKNVHITDVKRISYGKQGRDLVNNWVKINYDNGKTAFFADGNQLGWGGMLGGTEKILNAVRHLEQSS